MYFLTVMEVGSPRSQDWQVWFPLRPLCWACREMAAFLLCPHVVFYLGGCISHGSLWVRIFSFCKGTSQIGLGPTCMTSDNLNHLFKDPTSKYSHLLRYWRLQLGLKNCLSGAGGSGGGVGWASDPSHNSAHNATILYDF